MFRADGATTSLHYKLNSVSIGGCCTKGAISNPVENDQWPPAQNSRESTLRKEVSQLKRVLADKTLELDFFKVPCKKSRLDGSGAAALAGRHLRPNPGSDVFARQLEYRADVSTGPSESRRLLPMVAAVTSR